MRHHVTLPGSARTLLPNSRPAGPVDPNEIVSLSVRTRSSGNPTELAKLVQEQAALPLAKRKYLTREQLAEQFGSSKEDMDLVEDVAHKHNLVVVHRNAAERTIVLRGRLGDMLNT